MLQHDEAYWDTRIIEVAENAAGFYYEKTKHDTDLIIEALDAAKINLDKIPGMEADIIELKADMKMVKHAIKSTNDDLHHVEDRVTKLESITSND